MLLLETLKRLMAEQRARMGGSGGAGAAGDEQEEDEEDLLVSLSSYWEGVWIARCGGCMQGFGTSTLPRVGCMHRNCWCACLATLLVRGVDWCLGGCAASH